MLAAAQKLGWLVPATPKWPQEMRADTRTFKN